MFRNKVVDSFDDAVADIRDGATILVGGWAGPAGCPAFLLMALRKKGVKDLTIVCNTAGQFSWGELERLGVSFVDQGILFEGRQVKKVICTFPVLRFGTRIKLRLAEEQWRKGELDIEVVPQGTLAERLRAGGAGLGGVYTPVGVGTSFEKGKEKKVINGREYLLELPIRGDFAIVKAQRADKLGNLAYRGATRGFNHVMAKAADVTIAEVDELVEAGEVPAERVVTPGVYIDRLVVRPKDDVEIKRYYGDLIGRYLAQAK